MTNMDVKPPPDLLKLSKIQRGRVEKSFISFHITFFIWLACINYLPGISGTTVCNVQITLKLTITVIFVINKNTKLTRNLLISL